MFTKHSSGKFFAVALATLGLAGWQLPAVAQLVEEPASWQEHQAIDLAMGTLTGPVWQPVWFTPQGRRPGLQSIPFYRQQPPGAQEDFRPAPEPVAVSMPSPRPTTRSDDEPEMEPEPMQTEQPDVPDPDPPQQGGGNGQPCMVILC